MSFNIGSFFDDLSQRVLKSPFITSAMKNPIMTAGITSVIVVIIIFMIFSTQENVPLRTLALRSGFWIFIMLCGVLFLHNKILLAECRESSISGRYESILDSALIGGTDDFVRVVPTTINTDFTGSLI